MNSNSPEGGGGGDCRGACVGFGVDGTCVGCGVIKPAMMVVSVRTN